MSEFEIIERYFRPLTGRRAETRLGIGDDAALLAPPPGQLLALAVDTLVAGIHFPDDAPAESVGHKPLAVNLSDLAAMGAAPLGALLSLTLPRFEAEWLEGFARGFAALASRYRVDLLGGDTTRGPLSVTVQAIGCVPDGEALRRGGARPGDLVVVSGSLGDAALGLSRWRQGLAAADPLVGRLHYPEPRLGLGRLLRGHASACIDISDGLVADLGHILEASGVAARIDADAVPLSADFAAACEEDRRREYSLAWGDDYELCACLPPEALAPIRSAAEAEGVPITAVGEIRAGAGLEVVDGQGRPVTLAAGGYRHFRGGAGAE
ncbi:thiamine-phosphate kinase [Ectothiorhodospiraceae bacterium WFHF3C12]|nr:thiamine-phosphate kinase [Ectothiorhodospiraceae bacterium WFHF3C12]